MIRAYGKRILILYQEDTTNTIIDDAFAKDIEMAKQKVRPTRLGGFSGAKAYISYVKVLKNRRNVVRWIFGDAIMDLHLGRTVGKCP